MMTRAYAYYSTITKILSINRLLSILSALSLKKKNRAIRMVKPVASDLGQEKVRSLLSKLNATV